MARSNQSIWQVPYPLPMVVDPGEIEVESGKSAPGKIEPVFPSSAAEIFAKHRELLARMSTSSGQSRTTIDPMSQILSRLGIERVPYEETPIPGFEFAAAHRLDSQKVALFAVVGSEPVVIVDDQGDLFPSDQFITQIRLLQKQKSSP